MTDSVIIDPSTNQPFKKKALTRHVTRATLTGIRQASPGYSVASWLTPQRLAAVLRDAIDGDMEDYLVLAEEMEERDLHYASQIRTRKLAVSGLEPVIEAASEDKRDVELAEEIRALIKAPAFSDMLFDLLDGIGKGFSVVEVIWDTRDGRFTPKDYQWADPRFFQFDRETGRELRLRDNTAEGEALAAYKYLIHQPRIKSGLPIRNGLARLSAAMYMLKGYTLKDWWAFAEVFGMPIRVGKYGPHATDEEISTLVSAIANIASDAGAAIPESMQMELIETAKGNGGDTLFQNMAQWADSQLSKGILGQTMTADNGSSQSQATVHNEVRGDIQKDDARQLANTLQTLIQWTIDLNHGPQQQYPQITLPIIESEDLKALADALAPMIDRGLAVEQSQVRDRFGFADPKEGARLMTPEGQQAVPEPALNRQRLALNQQQSDMTDEALAELENELLADWQPVMQPLVDPIEQLAADCTSLEAFMQRLPELLEDGGMDVSALVKALAASTFKARGLGEASDEG
ncbi:DUF935 domain-containing protein [Candidatus Sororendozoicomonas aggregata]|uniref:DUF935 domain-containing protein n=1 Tax=Candidatus Sororendozoicomonas aggregata TaxID=3073239 RepID=UPI002ED3BCFC